jgi:hypothetical protein
MNTDDSLLSALSAPVELISAFYGQDGQEGITAFSASLPAPHHYK